MTKVISLKPPKKEKNSFLSNIIRDWCFSLSDISSDNIGTVLKLSLNPNYSFQKKKEFVLNYWSKFVYEFKNIDSKLEFDSFDTIRKYDSLTSSQRTNVFLDCLKIYLYNDKITYSKFIDIVNSYSDSSSVK